MHYITLDTQLGKENSFTLKTFMSNRMSGVRCIVSSGGLTGGQGLKRTSLLGGK